MPVANVTDQMGETISLKFPPKRIISLVPSQTELLSDLGLNDEVIGITKFCIHPQHWLENKMLIGGTKKFNFDTIDRLAPDLIIGNKEENYEEGIVKLKKRYPVWMSDIYTIEDSLAMIQSLGKMLNRKREASEIVRKISSEFDAFKFVEQRSVAYFIWKNPWMAAGKNTFIDDVLSRTGLINIVQGDRYPEIDPDQLSALKPDVVFLSSEPYPFQEKHIAEVKAIVPQAKVMLVDGEMFSWYGSRLTKACDYFRRLNL
jgi:ABC-type Fe3+-hydroxamate transport system substrate-binding protein